MRLPDTSGALLEVFSRRRDLMYQMAVVVAVASALMNTTANSHLTIYNGVDTSVLLSLFLWLGSVIYCLRFVQLHAGLVFHGVRFALIEFRLLGGELHPRLEKAANLNWRGVSVQVTVFFGVVAGLCTAVFLCFLLQHAVACAVCGGATTLALLIYGRRVHHCVVAREAHKFSRTPPEVAGDASDLRQHYIDSLCEAHLDMICITGTLTLLTFATTNAVASIMELSVNNKNSIGPVLFSGCASALGWISIRIYTRLQCGMIGFCSILGYSNDCLARRTIPDTAWGFVVVSGFFSLNLALLATSITRWLSGTFTYAFTSAATVAGATFFLGLVRHFQVISRYKSGLAERRVSAESNEPQ